MADYSTSNSTGSSSNQSRSTSTPSVTQTPQSEWGLQLSQLLAALTQNQYNWAMQQYNNGQGVTDQNINQYMQLAGQGAGLAQNLLGRYENVFEPLMNKFISQAGTYNSEARQRFMMGQAESTAGQADKAAMDSALRNLQSEGINPNSGRYEDLLLTSRMQDAATRAGAGTQASVNTANIGRQMTQQAAQMGQNVPGMTVNALQSAMTGVTGAENAILGQQNTGANLMNTVPNFANAASNAIKMPATGQNTQSNSTGQSGNQSTSQSPKQDQQKKQQPQQGGGAGAGGGDSQIPNLKPAGSGGNSSFQGNPYFQPNQPDPWMQGGAPTPYSQDPFNFGTTGNDGLFSGGPQGVPDLSQFVDTSGNAMPGATDVPYNADPFNFPDQSFDPGQQYDPGQAQDYFSQQGQYGGQEGNYGGVGSEAPGYAPGAGSSGGDYASPDMASGGNYDTASSGGGGGYYAAGGQVRGMIPNGTTGGPVPRGASPSRGRQTDDVPARLNAGEFVIPRDVTQHFGTKHFQDLIAKSRKLRTGMAGAPARPKMRPALQSQPTFTSQPMGQ